MATVAEYHQYAEECLRWATKAKTEEERKAFLDMARAWTGAALRIEGVLVPIAEDNASSKPTSH
jgi:hypothetical protein